MPAPHDLDPPAMTEEERLAKRRQQAAIAWEMHVTKVYNELEADRQRRMISRYVDANTIHHTMPR